MLIYLLRPNNTSLWLEEDLAKGMRLKHGERLTDEQFKDERVQAWLLENGAKAELEEQDEPATEIEPVKGGLFA